VGTVNDDVLAVVCVAPTESAQSVPPCAEQVNVVWAFAAFPLYSNAAAMAVRTQQARRFTPSTISENLTARRTMLTKGLKTEERIGDLSTGNRDRRKYFGGNTELRFLYLGGWIAHRACCAGKNQSAGDPRLHQSKSRGSAQHWCGEGIGAMGQGSQARRKNQGHRGGDSRTAGEFNAPAITHDLRHEEVLLAVRVSNPHFCNH
jgi:hypothetical protein